MFSIRNSSQKVDVSQAPVRSSSGSSHSHHGVSVKLGTPGSPYITPGVNITVRTPRKRIQTSSSSIKSPKPAQGTIRKNPLLRSAEREKIRELESKLRRKEEREKNEDIKKIEQQLDQLMNVKKLDNGRLERKLHSTNEELQATLHEMEEMRTTMATMERRLVSTERQKSQLEKQNEDNRREIEELKVELGESRRKNGSRRILSDANADNLLHKREDADDSVIEELHKARKEINRLNMELVELNGIRKEEQDDAKSLVRDLLIAVKVAENLKQEAENELGRFRDRSSEDPLNSDSAVWAKIKRGRERNTKRNALLAWAQNKLSPYSSLVVTNFSSDWSDGRAFCALVHAHKPEMIERKQFQESCVDLAVELAQKLNISGLDTTLFFPNPEWEKMMSVVFEMYKIFSVNKEEKA